MTAVKGFSDISYDELMDVNGGATAIGGAAVAGPVGFVAGLLVGAYAATALAVAGYAYDQATGSQGGR